MANKTNPAAYQFAHAAAPPCPEHRDEAAGPCGFWAHVDGARRFLTCTTCDGTHRLGLQQIEQALVAYGDMRAKGYDRLLEFVRAVSKFRLFGLFGGNESEVAGLRQGAEKLLGDIGETP